MTAGSIAVPTIVPLRVPRAGEHKNDIDSNTLIELKSATIGSTIYYTVDNTKPEPYRKLGENTTLLYKEPFMLRCGKRTVKSLARLKDGRESNMVTKVFNVKYATPVAQSDSDSDERDNEENFQLEMDRENKLMAQRLTTSVVHGSPIKLRDAWNTSPQIQKSITSGRLSQRAEAMRRSSSGLLNSDDTVKCVYCEAPRPKQSSSRFCGSCGKPVPVAAGSPVVDPGSMGMCVKCRSYIPLNQPSCIVCEEPIGSKLKPVTSIRFEDKIVCGACGKRNPSHLTHCASCEHRFPGPVHTDESAAPLPKLNGQLVKCPTCMRVNNPDARFCDWCGSKPIPEQSPLVCSLCKANNPPYSRFCAHCGANFQPPDRFDPRNSFLGDSMHDSFAFQDLPMWQTIPLPLVPRSPSGARILPAPRPHVRDMDTQTVGLFFPGGKKILREQEALADMRARDFRNSDKSLALSAVSPGRGYWRKQLDHVCGHLRSYTTNNVEFRSVFAEPRFGKITGAAIDEAEEEMTVSFTFALKGHTEFGEDGLRSLQRDIYHQKKKDVAFGSTFNPEKENVESAVKKKKLKGRKKSSAKLDKMTPEDRLLIKEVGPKGKGSVDEIKQLLMEGADPNCVDIDGITVLCHAVMENKSDCIHSLINAGADVNKPSDTTLNTPLHEAVKLGPSGKKIVELLLNNNAKTTPKNKKGMTAYDMAVKADYNSIMMLFNAHKGIVCIIMKKLNFILVLCLGQVMVSNVRARNDDHMNEIPQSLTEERAFRNGRVQSVWDKAKRVKLSDVTMTDLYADLKNHDRLAMEQKKIKATGEDDDGMKEAELRNKLYSIMSKYGLAGNKIKTETHKQQDGFAGGKEFIQDPKLKSLWNLAKTQGNFNNEELSQLEIEFMHHKRKLEEYELLKSDVTRMDDLSDNSVEKQVNSVENEEKRRRLNDVEIDIKDGYQRLHLKTKKAAAKDNSIPFTEPRVANMWQAALSGNFSEVELDSIKEELRHFQTRIEKHLFFKDQLKNSVEKVEYHGGKDKLPDENLRHHEHLQNKVQDLAAKVKKLHEHLSSKLSSGIQNHKEL